jgi:hypothetical protein
MLICLQNHTIDQQSQFDPSQHPNMTQLLEQVGRGQSGRFVEQKLWGGVLHFDFQSKPLYGLSLGFLDVILPRYLIWPANHLWQFSKSYHFRCQPFSRLRPGHQLSIVHAISANLFAEAQDCKRCPDVKINFASFTFKFSFQPNVNTTPHDGVFSFRGQDPSCRQYCFCRWSVDR